MRNMEREYSFINRKIFDLLDEKGISQKDLAAKNLEFEKAADLRDLILEIREKLDKK